MSTVKIEGYDMVEWQKWLRTRPQSIQDLAAKWPANVLYKSKETGQVFELQAYDEGGTVRAYVLPEYAGPVTGGCSVFGIDPETLEPATQAHLDARRAQFKGMQDIKVEVIPPRRSE